MFLPSFTLARRHTQARGGGVIDGNVARPCPKIDTATCHGTGHFLLYSFVEPYVYCLRFWLLRLPHVVMCLDVHPIEKLCRTRNA